VIKDLKIWKNFISDESWVPIPEVLGEPPISSLIFVSDAAGESIDSSKEDITGAASIGFNLDGEIFFARKLSWPSKMIKEAKDERGKRLGSKSLTLELLGLLIPFVSIPEQLTNKFVILKVDNLSCVYGWENGYAKEDEYPSIIIRCLVLITSFLGTNLTIKHLPRVSSWEAKKVDRMSRKSSSTQEDLNLLNSFEYCDFPLSLLNWLKTPSADWDLPVNILENVKLRVKHVQ
jgi:hypothetical protein